MGCIHNFLLLPEERAFLIDSTGVHSTQTHLKANHCQTVQQTLKVVNQWSTLQAFVRDVQYLYSTRVHDAKDIDRQERCLCLQRTIRLLISE